MKVGDKDQMALALNSTFQLSKNSWRGVRVSLVVFRIGWLTLEMRVKSRETVGLFSYFFKMEFVITTTTTCPIVLSTIYPLHVLNLEGKNYVVPRYYIMIAAVNSS